MSLSPAIIALLSLNLISLVLGTLAWVNSLLVAYRWDMHATSHTQYTLEKRSYLISVIIKYLFALKLPLFLFFIYTLDTLSGVITGAMCATGVVNSVSFGMPLLLFKLFNLYAFGTWLLIHRYETTLTSLAYTKVKLWLFGLLFIPFAVENIMEILFFTSLNISKIVSCCGTLFSAASTSSFALLFLIDPLVWVGMFYAFGLMCLIAHRLQHLPLLFFSNLMYLVFAIITLILFFSTYVYELPTHRCPFCLLQKDYYGVGYLLYTFLFIGTFSGMGNAIVAMMSKQLPTLGFKLSVIFNLLYLFSVSLYPLVYYIRNGVWL